MLRMTPTEPSPPEPTDQQLIARTAVTIGVPRAEVLGDRFSFVLHAPLELLARAALLPLVAPDSRDGARSRIVALGQAYDRSGPPVSEAREQRFPSLEAAADTLARAVADGDRDATDAAAAWLGAHARADELPALLGAVFLPSLGAAGHANIYLALLGRTQPRGLPGQMLRHPADALVSDSPRGIRVPEMTDAAPADDRALAELLERVCAVRPIAPPDSAFIAPLVEHAQSHGVLEGLTDADGRFTAPRRPAFPLLRFAAQAMLQGPVDQTPYGWTHCLTLAQAPLLLATAGVDVGPATYVAAAYLCAHWAGHGRGAVDLDRVPEPVTEDLADAIAVGPETAAAAAWHAEDRSRTVTMLATLASLHHDAHRVKYTLACLDAAACDPAAARLYLAAAAHLNSWWEAKDGVPQGLQDAGTPVLHAN